MKSLKQQSYCPIFCLQEKRPFWYKWLRETDLEPANKAIFFKQLVSFVEEMAKISKPPEAKRLALKAPCSLLKDENLVTDLSQLLQHYGYSSSSLLLFVQEKNLTDPYIFNEALAKLAQQGFQLSVDDFLARRESGFAALESPHIHYIRISADVTRSLAYSETLRSYAQGTLQLARQLSKEVIFEGVDNEQTFNRLVKMGAALAQGEFLSSHLASSSI